MSAWTAEAQQEYERDLRIDEYVAAEMEREARRGARRESGLLYLIWAVSTPYVKIGVASDFRRRLRTLQTGCPYEHRVLARLMFEHGGAEDVERYLHDRLGSWRHRGEWFEIPPKKAVDAFWTAVEWWAADHDLRVTDPVAVA